MDRIEDDNVKKRRRLLEGPDGFSKPLSTSTSSRQKAPAPRFESAFAPTTPTVLKKSTFSTAQQHRPHQPFQRKGGHSASRPHSDTPLKPLRPPLPDPFGIHPSESFTRLSSLPVPLDSVPDHASSSSSFKPVHIHALALPDSSSKTGMKPLTTTPFAAYSTFDSSGDSSELASILLQHRPSISSESIHPVNQSVESSPVKQKLVRGGMAARASRLFNLDHTSTSLWRAAMELQPALQMKPEMTFHLHKVVHSFSLSNDASSSVITLCRPKASSRMYPFRKQLVYVVLRFSGARADAFHDPGSLAEGCSLHIWEPWYEVQLEGVSHSIPSASLPLPPSSSDESAELSDTGNVHHTVLLCSRFSVARQ